MNADTPKPAAVKTDAVASKTTVKAPAGKKVASVKAAAKPSNKPAEKKVAEVKKAKKETKVKVVRDSFTMPQSEYQKIAALKELCLTAGLHVKKSEILRAGLQALTAMSVPQLKNAVAKLDKIATGRPKKS